MLEQVSPDMTLSSLGEKLRRLEPRNKEARTTFLTRAAGLAAEYPEDILGEDDLRAASDHLIIWRFSEQEINGADWVAARRIVFSRGGE